MEYKGIDPSVDKNFPLKWAIINGHHDIVRLLLTDDRVQKKMNLLPKTVLSRLNKMTNSR
jgi:hypothetical protein